jgi:uncharacterized protein YvpB
MHLKKFIPFLILLVVSCASLPPTGNPQFTEDNLPVEYHIEGVEPLQQLYNACVPTCAAMIFAYHGKSVDKEVIADWVQKAYGTTTSDIEDFARWQGFNIYTFTNSGLEKKKIKYFLTQNYPVLVAGKFGYSMTGHMIVLVGYDNTMTIDQKGKPYQGVFFAIDPGPGQEIKIPYDIFKEFHSGRDNLCMVIYPKGRKVVKGGGGTHREEGVVD